jgi:hypothetical protein
MKKLLLCLVLSTCAAPAALAQSAPGAPEASQWNPMQAFLRPYGLSNFNKVYKRILSAWLRAAEKVAEGNFPAAERTLDTLWLRHPIGGLAYGNQVTQPFGINIGSPPCYYGLRMLTDITQWRATSGVLGYAPPRSAKLTVMLVGQSHGIEPRDLVELSLGTGLPVTHTLDQRLLDGDNRIVHQSLELFREYVYAITQGQLGLDVQVLHLPSADLAVHAYENQGRFYAGLENPSDVWASVPESIQEETDWWMLLYPSHVPEQYSDFQSAEFVTGGMGAGVNDLSPLFLADDRWLVRKPPHIGTGPYTELERRAYLPQWLQHEFFHHLFRTFPEFGLELTSHQWFDSNSWPSDFEGRYEADYFHEALFKRLQSATPPMHVRLRYATADAPWQDLVLTDVMGEFRREPVQNNWHIGRIEPSGSGLKWTNNAGVSWLLSPDLLEGELLTGPDCPYYAPPNGTKFSIVLKRDGMGDLTNEVEGFSFSGEIYTQQ